MTGKRLLAKVKRSIKQSGWIEDIGLGFRDIYLKKPDGCVPSELLIEDDLLSQIRRKFYYPFDAIAEALASAAIKIGSLSKRPVILSVIDADYEYATGVYLIWSEKDIILTKEWRRATDFWFHSDLEMEAFLERKYSEGLAQIQEIAGREKLSPKDE